jgi:hypothetical protein
MIITWIIIAAFLFGCCAITGFARRLWKFLWKLVAAVFILVALLCLAARVNNVQDGIAHPPGSDEKHSKTGNAANGKVEPH